MAIRFEPRSLVAAAAAVCIVLALGGCQRKGLEDLLGDELFSLSLGKLDNQIDLFQLEGTASDRRTTVAMRDGWFYVANGNAGKIMVFSSYGDLLFLLYNPATNPPPAGLATVDPSPAASGAGGPEPETTRGAVAWPFTDIGEIAVASDRTLYVDDEIAEAKAVKDPARGMVLSRVVLRFDRKGRSLGYLGQEGIGGTPFPYVSNLFVTGRDELVVVCRLPDSSWEVYWFSRDGVLLYKAALDSEHLPVLATQRTNPVLVGVFPDAQKPLLYLAINTYATSGASLATDAPNEVSSRAYRLDLRTRRYEPNAVEFPPNPPRRERVQLKTTEVPSPPAELLGLSSSGDYYLMSYTDTNLYTLQVLDPSGRLRATRRVVIEDADFVYRDLHLAPSGLLYGLFVDRLKARVSWWRSDLVSAGGSP